MYYALLAFMHEMLTVKSLSDSLKFECVIPPYYILRPCVIPRDN